jgi:hypothetical protein
MGASLCSGFFSQNYLSTRENVHEAYFLSKNTFMKQFCKNLKRVKMNLVLHFDKSQTAAAARIIPVK